MSSLELHGSAQIVPFMPQNVQDIAVSGANVRHLQATVPGPCKLPLPTTVGDPMPINTTTTGPNPMKCFMNSIRAKLLKAFGALTVTAFVTGGAAAATPTIDESQLLNLGFKVLVATTKVQQDWVRSLPPGQIRPMQRTGKKFFIYPDAARNQIYVGGPAEFEAYRELHPEGQQSAQDGAARTSAYRGKQDAAMRSATARDLSDPFLGASWSDLGW